MLIVIRGNSGSGKSSTALRLRDALISLGYKRKIALVQQDYLRRVILKEKLNEGTDNIDLIFQTVMFALNREYTVILEGILFSERYREMLVGLKVISKENYFYYLNVSFDETLRRHKLKVNSHEFGENEMRYWYKPNDILGFKNEKVIDENMSQVQIIKTIITDIGMTPEMLS